MPGGGVFRLRVIVNYNTGRPGVFYKNLPGGTANWTRYWLNFTAARNFSSIRAEFQYRKAGGTIWLDDVILVPN